MTDAALQAFRKIADDMSTGPKNWQWIGPHMSQRMFGITEARAKAYAARHGGEASPYVTQVEKDAWYEEQEAKRYGWSQIPPQC